MKHSHSTSMTVKAVRNAAQTKMSLLTSTYLVYKLSKH